MDSLKRYVSIGIQHDFLCISITEKHVWSLLLHKNTLSLENVGENASKSSFFLYLQWRWKAVTCEHFENPASRAKTNVILTSQNYVRYCAYHWLWCQFLWMLIRKTAKPCINSTSIALVIHGFVPVKTWLLIACDTVFYAIMKNDLYSYQTSFGQKIW